MKCKEGRMAKTILWLLFTIVLALKFNSCYAGIFSWLFTKYDVDKNNYKVSESDVNKFQSMISEELTDSSVLSVKVPFELKTSDEKFVNEIAKYAKLSDLDVCHHKVILSLHKSCSDLTEEELSKVAVNLLNCQSSVENRKLYACTESMILSECTRDMDQNTWNAYHIISNRVRAVCYHFRQQQFTAKTEMTVNKLVHSAEEQIDAMKLLEVSQSNLKDATSETLNTLKSGHKMLEKEQENLSSAQVSIRNYVSSNIRDLTREKRLIASGQKELAGITLAIKRKLEDAQEQLKDQGIGQRDTHQKILQDLSDIQDGASRVWGQIDASTKAILLKHEQTVANYERLMDDLQKMNSTVHHLMDILIKMKVKVEEKFSWISSLVGDTDATVQKIYNFVLHICYILLGMVAASFLQVPYATKMALIIVVPLNALAELKNESSLDFSALSIVLAICMFLNLSSVGAVKLYRWRKNKRLQSICGSESFSLTHNIKQIDSEESFNNLSDLRSQTNRSNIFEDSSKEDFSTTKYLNKSSNIFSSPLTKITEENGINGHIENRSTLWSSDRNQPSPFTFAENVRRRLLSQRDNSPPPPPSPSESLSGSLNESLFSGYGLNMSKSKSFINNTTARSSQSTTPKKICISNCKNGLPCKNIASAGFSFCHKHLAGPSRESTPLR